MVGCEVLDLVGYVRVGVLGKKKKLRAVQFRGKMKIIARTVCVHFHFFRFSQTSFKIR